MNKIIKIGVCLLPVYLGASLFTSCEDDSLPDVGSIEDLTPPTARIAVGESSTSSRTKILLNKSNSAINYLWTLPEGASFAENLLTGETSVATDADVYVDFEAFDTTYTVSLEAKDGNGVSDEITQDITPEYADNIADPSAAFTYEDTEGNFVKILDATSSSNNDGGVNWVFPEGLEVTFGIDEEGNLYDSNDAYAEVIFPVLDGLGGTYPVTLQAINYNGEINEVTQDVVVSELPAPSPAISFTSSADYLTKTLVNETPDTDTLQWSLPNGVTLVDGYTLTDETIEVEFSEYRTYSISLTVTNVLSVSTTESFNITALNPDDIEIPTIVSASFEAYEGDNPANTKYYGNIINDISKEDWRADGESDRSYKLENEGIIPDLTNNSWFSTGGYNRVQTTNNSVADGGIAVKWESGKPNRVAVQVIEVTPGVDYKLTFQYANITGTPDVGIRAAILKESTSTEQESLDPDNIIAEVKTTGTSSAYVEETLTFSSSSEGRVKIYFNQIDNAGEVYLDDISITID